jgi:hypothetical protein
MAASLAHPRFAAVGAAGRARRRGFTTQCNQVISQHQPQRTGANGICEAMRVRNPPVVAKARGPAGTLCYEIK